VGAADLVHVVTDDSVLAGWVQTHVGDFAFEATRCPDLQGDRVPDGPGDPVEDPDGEDAGGGQTPG
jgi:hypothetical protein